MGMLYTGAALSFAMFKTHYQATFDIFYDLLGEPIHCCADVGQMYDALVHCGSERVDEAGLPRTHWAQE